MIPAHALPPHIPILTLRFFDREHYLQVLRLLAAEWERA